VDLKKYEEFVRSTWSPNVNDEYRPIWAAAELAAESGEVSGVAVKAVRRGTKLDVARYTDELGDVLWSLTAAALSVGTDLDGLMKYNTEKLTKRWGDKPIPKGDNNIVPGQ